MLVVHKIRVMQEQVDERNHRLFERIRTLMKRNDVWQLRKLHEEYDQHILAS